MCMCVFVCLCPLFHCFIIRGFMVSGTDHFKDLNFVSERRPLDVTC
jgi:hypothetical protein